jgi:hypothetical protein
MRGHRGGVSAGRRDGAPWREEIPGGTNMNEQNNPTKAEEPKKTGSEDERRVEPAKNEPARGPEVTKAEPVRK